jgi:hypothetical protein
MVDSMLPDVFSTVRHDFTDPVPADFSVNNPNRANDRMLVNCFTISANTGGVKESYIHKRCSIRHLSGLDFNSILGAVNATAVANAVMTSLNDVYVAAYFDSTNSKHVIMQYRPQTGTTVKIGEITSTTVNDDVYLTELTIAAVCTLGVVWNKADGTTSKGYYATSGATGFAAASLTEIVDVDFPPKRGSPLPLVGPMVQMNGTTYVMTNTGEIANSDTASITSWNSSGTIQAISYPDQGVGLVRYKHHLVAFGEDSIEFFNDVGNPPPKSPLARTEQAFIKFGALTPRAILAVDDTVYFLAKSGSGTLGLFRFDGYTPVKCSPTWADTAISTTSSYYPIVNTGILSAITLMGVKHLCLGGTSFIPALSTGVFTAGQLMYNIQENEMWLWEANQTASESLLSVSQYQLSNSNPDTQYVLIGNATGAPTNSARYYAIYQLGAGGQLQFRDRYGVDSASSDYYMFVQTNKLSWGTEKRKRIHKVKAIIDMPVDVGPAAATLTFGWVKGIFDQMYNTTITTRTSTLPNTEQRYYISNLGQARTWQFCLYTNSSARIRLRALEFDISQSAH